MNYENSEKLRSMKAIIRQETLDARRKMLDVRQETLDARRKMLDSAYNTSKESIVYCLATIVRFISLTTPSSAQVLRLDSVLSVIKERNPILQDFRQRANAMNAYSAGSTSWMAPEVGGGLWMMPYKKVEDP